MARQKNLLRLSAFIIFLLGLNLAAVDAGAQTVYDFDVIAQTGAPVLDPDPTGAGDTGPLVDLGRGPSINNPGKVAFIARDQAGSYGRVIVSDNGTIERNFEITSNQVIGNQVQVNDSSQVTWQDEVTLSGDTFIRRLDSNSGGESIGVGSNFLTNTPFNFVAAGSTINQSGRVAFTGDLKTGGTVLANRPDGSSPHNMTNAVGGFPTFYAMMADNNRTVIREEGTPGGGAAGATLILLSDETFSAGVAIAGPPDFSAIAEKPGLSDDGNVASFLGVHATQGTGIYARATTGTVPFKVAGVSGDGRLDPAETFVDINGNGQFDPGAGEADTGYFTAFSSLQRVGANRTGADVYTLAYVAVGSGNLGVGNQVGLFTSSVNISQPSNPTITPPSAVIQAGDTVPGLTGTVTEIGTYDPVNTHGQIVFWVKTSAGAQAIVRARPKPGATMPPSPCRNDQKTGDPVATHNGQYSYECADLVIPGRGMDINIRHHYLGQTGQVSQFGFGWHMSYHERLNVLPDGSAKIQDATGREDIYSFNAGVYQAPAGFYQTLVKNADNSWVLTERDGRKRLFDALGRLSRVEDRAGNAIVLTYDPAGKLPITGPNASGTGRQTLGSDYRLTKVTGANGREVNFVYNADGLLGLIQDAATGRAVSFTYHSLTNDLLLITHPATAQFPSGITKGFTYDGRHNLLTITDAKNQIFVVNVYDAQNRVIRQTLGAGDFTFVYAPDKTTVTDRKGFVTVYEFNAQGNPVKITRQTKALRPTDPAAFVTSNTYNPNMEKLSTVFPKGNGIFYKYDITNADPRARGNLLEARRKSVATAPDNDTADLVVKYMYEPRFNQVKSMTDARGKVTTYTYDYELPTTDPRFGNVGNLVKVEAPLLGTVRPTTLFSYNSNGQPVEIIDPNGIITRMAYFTDTGYLQSIARDPLGINAVTQFTYDAFGNVNQVTDPNGRISRFEYNELGWLLSTTNALTRKVRYTHDANGNILKEERQSNTAATAWQTIQYTYDLSNHLKTVRDPLTRLTTFNYDLNENPLNRVDALNNTTAYVYDERDLLFKVTDANTPSAGVTQYDYDSNGLLKTLTDAKGNKTTYTYDGFDRLTRTTYPDARFEQYFYDKNSNMTRKITPNNETINYVYDALNRLTAQTYADTTMNVTYSYDLGSRLTRVRNSFSDVTYLYNKLNFLIRETHKFGTLSFAVNSSYDKSGNRTKVTYPSGKVVNYVYNALNQMTQAKVNGVALANYSYDVLNRLTWKDLLGATTKRAAHTYDLANQLKVLENKLVTSGAVISKHSYTYDLAGNRLSHVNQTAATATMNFAYNPIYELTGVTGAQTHGYAYDKVGNRTTADSVAYVSNNLNQYTTVGGAALTYNFNGNLTQEPGASYVYDAENRLLQVTKGTTVANYRYDPMNRRVSREIGAAKTFYIHDGNEVVEERDSTGALVADYVLGPRTDEILTMTRGGQTYYYFYDGLGSVRQITDVNGAIIESYDYDVYGQPVALSSVGNPAMFTGRWFDSESGLYYYRARYYSPTLGRFLQRDPIGYLDDMNLYVYVKNNPINRIDPLGLYWLEDLSNFSAGFGDTSTFGATEWIREYFNYNDVIDTCSKWYKAGQMSGMGADISLGGLGLLKAAAKAGIKFAFWRYPRAGGAGFNIFYNGKRFLGFDWHWFKLKGGGKVFRPHIDSDILKLKHWPWNR